MSTGNQPNEPIILTLENSVIKAKKASQPTARITDIEQWTTAYTLYMSIMTHQFPGWAQELLQYMSLIYAMQPKLTVAWVGAYMTTNSDVKRRLTLVSTGPLLINNYGR